MRPSSARSSASDNWDVKETDARELEVVVLVRLGVLEDQEVALDAVADALSRESVLHDAKSSSSVSGGICADISACLFEEAWRRWKLSEMPARWWELVVRIKATTALSDAWTAAPRSAGMEVSQYGR